MFTLETVVPWGRSYDEYRRMFALSDADLARRILGCADGPASFNAEATRLSRQVVSCDPLYRCSVDQIRTRIADTRDHILDQTRRNAHEFVWDTMKSVDNLGRVRMQAMDAFLDDYDPGKAQARYIDAELPTLPFEDRAFDLALCSHFLFLYEEQLDEEFHRRSALELCRVAAEVRVFPLLAMGGAVSRHVDAVVDAARAAGHEASIETVPYEFQRNGNQMLRLRFLDS